LNSASATFGLTSTARKWVIEKSRSEDVAVDPAGDPGREAHESIALVDVRFVADDGLKAGIAGGPKSANKRLIRCSKIR
jgi:hypothetical protein